MKASTLVIREVFKSASKDERDKMLMENIINMIDNERKRKKWRRGME